MSSNFYDLLKYANTRIASPEMTHYDKMRALSMAGGKVKTLTGVPPLSFRANGKPLISLSMLGNGQQTGTPAPNNIIVPDFCGELVGTDWTIPITCGGQTTPVYLGQTQTVRQIKKLVLKGSENWERNASSGNRYYFRLQSTVTDGTVGQCVCTHYASPEDSISASNTVQGIRVQDSSLYGRILIVRTPDYETATTAEFQAFLASQYAAGTPVTVWYVIAEPETGIVNEPLAKIGDYADELHSDDTTVSIPTVRGQNALTVDTDLQPSSMTITYTK